MLRIAPILVIFHYSKFFDYDIPHIFLTFIGAFFSRFVTRLVIMDYLVLNQFLVEEREYVEEEMPIQNERSIQDE